MIERCLIVCAGLLIAAGAGLVNADENEAPAAETRLAATDVLELIDRARRLQADSAVLMRDSLAQLARPTAELELALLEIFGPEPVLDPGAGLARLLAVAPSGSGLLSPEAAVLVESVQVLVIRLQAQSERHQRLLENLEAERQAHRETSQKLEALRRIDQQLEQLSGDDLAPNGGPNGGANEEPNEEPNGEPLR